MVVIVFIGYSSVASITYYRVDWHVSPAMLKWDGQLDLVRVLYWVAVSIPLIACLAGAVSFWKNAEQKYELYESRLSMGDKCCLVYNAVSKRYESLPPDDSIWLFRVVAVGLVILGLLVPLFAHLYGGPARWARKHPRPTLV